MSKTVIFCFDFGSPYSYLAYNNLQIIRDSGAKIQIKPVLLGGIFKATGNQSPAMVVKKGEYMFKDIKRQSRKLNLEFKINPYFPILTIPHMRGAILAEQLDILEPYMEKMFQAIWVKGMNLNNQEILSKVAEEAGINVNTFSEGIMSNEVKNRLKENTQFAIDKGAFGVPTYFYENEIFWGIDSIKFLLYELSQ